ncbi:MAG TPA: gamma-glutamyltransferase [Pseudomonadales bacterium]|nr:gamma-glutamyltransferase [Pseudomonadales bacterium]
MYRRLLQATVLTALCASAPMTLAATQKPVLHGQHWMAVTGKPLAATSGARTFMAGGNAVDAACTMLATTSTMWDTLGWGGETQTLIWHPKQKKVIGINALGAAPTGATPEFFHERGMDFPPEYGPLAAVTPGTPGGLMVMLAEYGSMSLAEVLAPAIEMADGYPIEAGAVRAIGRSEDEIRKWPPSVAVFLPNDGAPPRTGEIFRQADLAATLRKLVATEAEALASGKSRKDAIMAAYDRFYRGDIAEEFVRGSQALGGLHTMADLDRWQVYIEEPVKTSYKGIDVYKLTSWVQGPMMLQALNMLEPLDMKAKGYNSADYIHTLYQVMNLAFADRDFYYGDPYFPPAEPMEGLLSKRYAADRVKTIDPERNDPFVKPGDPYPYQGDRNPFTELLENWTNTPSADGALMPPWQTAAVDPVEFERTATLGTTSIQTADAEGWVVSVTPSGGWIPAAIAGRTGIGMSQRMQSFVLDAAENPYNVLEPGKRPRATLTPTMAVRDGAPWLAFSVQGGDTQEQNLIQFFLNMAEFGMNVQEAAEAANVTSFQLRDSFGDHRAMPGRLLVNDATPPWVIDDLKARGYDVSTRARTSGPITAIEIDREHGTLQGGASNYGDDYGIAW